jgi:hypothetical protein
MIILVVQIISVGIGTYRPTVIKTRLFWEVFAASDFHETSQSVG